VKLSTLAFNAAGAVTARPWLIGVAAAALAASLVFAGIVGARFERAGWLERQAKAVEKARAAERDGVGIMNAAEGVALAADRRRLADSERTIQELRDELQKRPAKCPVSRRAVGVLDGNRVPADSRPSARVEANAAAVAADANAAAAGAPVECGAVLEHCAWNRVNVCDKAADQAEQLQAVYEQLRRRYNRN